MSKLLLIAVIIISLEGCSTRMAASYAKQEPLPIDLSSTKYLYALTQGNELFQVAAISPSVLAQRARPQIQEYFEKDNTQYDEDFDEDSEDDYEDEE
ncbi:MAG: hypothetical protein Q8O24_00430 [Gallionellaceae bacterium]|nr:hypothetical protein [Gallionellaceae bacterium]